MSFNQQMQARTGPTGLEGMTSIGAQQGLGVRSVAGLTSTVIPGALTVGGMLAGADPFSATLGAFKGGAGIHHSLLSKAGWAGKLNPATGQMAGGLAQAGVGRIGMGLAAGAGVAGAFALGSAAMNYAGQQITIGAARRGRLQQYLGSKFGYNAGQGRGMTGNEVSQVSDELYSLARDLDRNVSQITRNLGTMKQLNLTRSIRNVQEFRQTMRQTMEALDKIADTYGVTMREAGQFLQGARAAGFRDIKSQLATVTPVLQAQWATGMTRSQVQQSMVGGAGLARAIGATSWRGAIGAQRSLVGLGAAQRAGIVSEGMLEEATGVMGPGATAAFGQVAQTALARRLRSRFGRYFLAAGATGDMRRLDPEQMQDILSGAYSMRDIKRRARRAVYGRGRRGMDRRFLVNEEEMRGQLLQQGPMALAGMVRAELGSRLYDTEDPRGNKMVRRAYGLTKRQAEVVLRMARRLPEMMAQQFREEETRLVQQSRGRSLSATQRLGSAIRGWVRSNIDEPLQRIGGRLQQTFTRAAEGIASAIVGGGGRRPPVHTISRGAARVMTEMAVGGFAGAERALMGDPRVRQRISGLVSRATGGASREQFEREYRAGTLGTIGAGWQVGGFGSEAGAAAAMGGGFTQAAARFMTSGTAVEAARSPLGAMAVFAPRAAAATMGRIAGAQGGRLGEFFQGANTMEEYSTRYAMMVRRAGGQGLITGMGVGQAQGVGGGLTRRMTQGDEARFFRQLTGERAPTRGGMERGGGFGGMIAGAVGGAARWLTASPSPRGFAQTLGGQAGAFRTVMEDPTLLPILMRGFTGGREAQQQASRRLYMLAAQRGLLGNGRVSSLTMSAARTLAGGAEGGGGRFGMWQQALQQSFWQRNIGRYREMVSGRMGALNFGARGREVLQQTGLLGGIRELQEQGTSATLTPGQRTGTLGRFYEQYMGLKKEQRERVRRVIFGQGGAAGELISGIQAIEPVMTALGGRRGGQAVRGKRLRMALGAMGMTLTKKEAARIGEEDPAEFARRHRMSQAFAEQVIERGGDKRFTAQELQDLARTRAQSVSMASYVGNTVTTATEEILGVQKGGAGSPAAMHAEMRRQSSYLALIAKAASDGFKLTKKDKALLQKLGKQQSK